MLIKGRNSEHASNKQTPIEVWGGWIPEATEQHLIKFVLRLYHKVQYTFSVLGDKTFPEKTFLSAFNFRKTNRK